MPEQLDVQIEQEIVDLSKAIHESGIVENSKEALRAAIGEKLSKLPPLSPSDSRPPQAPTPGTSSGSLPGYAADLEPEVKLRAEKILDMFVHKGLLAAMSEARKSDPLTMELFHDAITEKLYEKFHSQGLIK